MFVILETAIAFLAILMALSLFVKSITSAMKMRFDYYSQNLEKELVNFMLSLSFVKDYQTKLQAYFGDRINCSNPEEVKKLGALAEELMDEDIVFGLLGLDPESTKESMMARVREAKAKLKILKANVSYQFSTNMKKLSLTVGLAMCLLANVNAFTIWQTLYADANVRAKFTSAGYLESLNQRVEDLKDENPPEGSAITKADLEAESTALLKQTTELSTDLNFGIGAIYSQGDKANDVNFWIFQLLGSLLTGLMISIGAPYIHDLLRSLTEIRNRFKPATSTS